MSETAKNLNICSTESEELSEDESLVDHPLVKKKRLNSTHAASSIRSENSKPSLIDELNGMSFRNKDTDTGKVQKDESEEIEDDNEQDVDRIKDDTTQSHVQSLDQEDAIGVVHMDEQFENSDKDGGEYNMDVDQQNISKDELKDRFYRSGNNMKVFELDLDADEALTNIDLLRYIDELKVPKFRGVFMRDELPEKPNPVECGIVNLSTHEQMGTHWVCYARIHNTRVYFDSVGRKTPLEIQYYLKTAEEFENGSKVIERNPDVVQRPNTKICGHMCLFVLTSLMREHLSFQHIMDQLTYGHSQYNW